MRGGAGPHGGGRGRFVRALTALLLLFLGLTAQAPAPPAPEGARMLVADGVRVVYWPGGRGQAAEVLAAARTPVPLPGFPRRVTPTPSTIVLAPSPAIWDSVTGGRIPEWGAGVAFPATRTIVLPVYPSPRTRPEQLPVTLRHELVHLALREELPGPIPRWFDEGYAEWVSGGWTPEDAWQLRLAFALGRAPPLDSLTLGWPRGAGEARLAYLLSATAVQHLASRSGPEGFETLMWTWQEEGSLDRAIRRAYGMTLGQFEEEWREMVKARYGWLLVLSQMTVFWLLLVPLLLLLVMRRRQRDRAKLEAMRAEERMLPPPPPPGLDVDYPLE